MQDATSPAWQPGSPWSRRLTLPAIAAVHAGLLLLLLAGTGRHPSVMPPVVVSLLSLTPEAPPAPPPPPLALPPPRVEPPRLPWVPPPEVQVAPLPVVPAITAAPEPAPPQATLAPPPAPAAPPATTAPAPAPQPEPVVPPRADAAHLNNPAPVYPATSRRLREQGVVLLDVYILPDGSVGDLRVKRSSGFARLDEAALQAVRRWRYLPARRGDQPIAFWYVQPLEFAMR